MKASFYLRLWILVLSICISTSIIYKSVRGREKITQSLITIFEDNFETYDVGTFPSEGDWQLIYSGAGSSYQKVVDTVSFSPTNSLQLLGRGEEGGSHRAAIATKAIESSGSILAYETHVMVEDISAFESSAVVGFGKGFPSGFGRSNEVRFCSNGMITTWVEGGEKCGTPLQSYSPDTWYKIHAELNTVTDNFSIWIDDELKGSDFKARFPSNEITDFALTSNYGNTKAYFDNVKLYSEGVGGTNVLVDPELTELGIGETFTATVHILNVEDLYGLDVHVGWNTTLLDYINHSITIPVESYPEGILHEPIAEFRNEVNQTSGTSWIAYTSLNPVMSFSGNGIVVEMTFRTINHGVCNITILSSELVDFDGLAITHSITHAIVTIHDFHDIAITDLSVGKTIVGEGYCTNVSVSVVNQGTFSENFNITLHANETAIGEATITLESRASIVVNFVWNTTGWSKGYYILSALALPVTNETNTFDNTYIDGFIFLTIPGDVDGDRDIDIFDAVKIARIYGSQIDDIEYDPICDINDDGTIDIFDIVIAVSKYGQNW